MAELTDGHQIAAGQLAKHGRDRYPDPQQQALKVCAEAGELGDAILKACTHWQRASDGSRAELVAAHDRLMERVRAEYADTGLALFELGNKLGIDLIEAMRELVAADGRKFDG